MPINSLSHWDYNGLANGCKTHTPSSCMSNVEHETEVVYVTHTHQATHKRTHTHTHTYKYTRPHAHIFISRSYPQFNGLETLTTTSLHIWPVRKCRWTATMTCRCRLLYGTNPPWMSLKYFFKIKYKSRYVFHFKSVLINNSKLLS
jgi:hypothetical protein